MSSVRRRAFLVHVPAGCLAALGARAAAGDDRAEADSAAPVHAEFPAQDPTLVREIVGRAHFDLDAVRDLVAARPALAKAAWDWGFGDWESALGAASHMGRRDIAEVLTGHGARPNLFTFAMLDQVEAVRAIVEANPGVARLHGPHGITLLAHARNGKAERVIEYLEGIEGADVPQAGEPLDAERRRAYLGTYSYGPGRDETLSIVELRNGSLGIQRGERSPRNLVHVGDHAFHPTGAPSVRIDFRMGGRGAAEALTVHDADLVVSARRAG